MRNALGTSMGRAERHVAAWEQEGIVRRCDPRKRAQAALCMGTPEYGQDCVREVPPGVRSRRRSDLGELACAGFAIPSTCRWMC